MTEVAKTPKGLLQQVWGYDEFRPLQEDVITAVASGQDVLALMPTGGGKSICYQLPALLKEGTAIVISPLISLMKDQVDALVQAGVPAAYINSSLSPGDVARTTHAVATGELKLLYVAPERTAMGSFRSILQGANPSLFAIDEAHCISEWGHDFRPEYRQLKVLRRQFQSVPFAAFTATATERVRADILRQLELRSPATFVGSFNRPNLNYTVNPKSKSVYSDLLDYLKTQERRSGIIYRSSRAGTDELAERLRSDGINVARYHAGLDDRARMRNQEAFARDRVDVVVATVAFGLGINKADVRYVIHYDMPRTLENYYQESGRAGRDGDSADCILFYARADVARYRKFADEKPAAERTVAHAQLKAMADWAEDPLCRRNSLLAYFGEALSDHPKVCCDNCTESRASQDVTTEAQMFLSCVKRTGERFGAAHIADVLRGSRTARVLEQGHDKLSTHGIGKHWEKEQWMALSRSLVQVGALRTDEHGSLKLEARGSEILFGRQPFVAVLPKLVATRRSDSVSADVPYPELFEQLRQLRMEIAGELNVPPYVVLHDRALRAMVVNLPVTIGDLQRIPGIGERKLSTFGDRFVNAVRTYCETNNLSRPAVNVPSRSPRVRGLSDSQAITVQMLQTGMGVAEIAEKRGFAKTTITGHLAEAIAGGLEVDLDRLVDPVRQLAIRQAAEKVGADRLGPIKDYLGEDFDYGEIRVVMAHVRENGAEDKPGSGSPAGGDPMVSGPVAPLSAAPLD